MQEGKYEERNDNTPLSRLSWTVYLKTIIASSIIASIIGFVITQFTINHNLYLSILVCILFLHISYNIAFFRSVIIYYNNEGVWIYSGILPWSKGYSGLRWRDIDEAGYFNGFTSWISKSYKIKISHRFTKSNELILNSMHNGHKAVKIINDLHGKYCETNSDEN